MFVTIEQLGNIKRLDSGPQTPPQISYYSQHAVGKHGEKLKGKRNTTTVCVCCSIEF